MGVTRTFKGMRLRSQGAGSWLTEDGRYRFSYEESGITSCDNPHPIRSGGGKGEYCPGDETHYFFQWCVHDEVERDYAGERESRPLVHFDSLADAVSALGEHLERNKS